MCYHEQLGHYLISKTNRERDINYAKLNLALFPGYHILRAGTGAYVYTDNTNKFIGTLFLHWDNKEVILEEGSMELKDVCCKLIDGGYVVREGWDEFSEKRRK